MDGESDEEEETESQREKKQALAKQIKFGENAPEVQNAKLL